MKSILITGCNRGLGLGLVQQLLKTEIPPTSLIATCRNIEKAEELRQLSEHHKNVHILEIDLKDFNAYEEFSENVSNIVKDDGLNVLFNNAGMSPKFARINFVKPEQLIDAFKTNTMAPVMLSKVLLPLLKKAVKNNSTKPSGIEKAAIINMSSILGSFQLNTSGGLYPYRCSKAALNIATQSLSIDLKNEGIIVTSLHPGWVKTNLGGTNAPMDIKESTSSIVQFLTTLSEEHNGGFYQWDGKPLSW